MYFHRTYLLLFLILTLFFWVSCSDQNSANEKSKVITKTTFDLWLPQAYNIMQDPKEYTDILLQNLWLLSPALKQLAPFYVSLRQYGMIQPGDSKPTQGEIDIPFEEQSELKKIFESLMVKAKSDNK